MSDFCGHLLLIPTLPTVPIYTYNIDIAYNIKQYKQYSLYLRFSPGVRAHKGITIVLSLFTSHWLAVTDCLAFCIGSCEPVHEDRTFTYQ